MEISGDMLRENIGKFDWVIFLFFGINLLLFVLLIITENITHGYKHPLVVSLYRFFENITSLFPLLGVFGTVTSLMTMVGGGEIEVSAFSAALTSTFWGLIAAMICKLIDGFVSAGFDRTDDVPPAGSDKYGFSLPGASKRKEDEKNKKGSGE